MLSTQAVTDNIIEVTFSDTLKGEDFKKLENMADTLIKEHGSIRVLINASAFNGWENTDAAEKHFSFVKRHHQNVERLVIVAGHLWQHWLATLARVFIHPTIKVFDKDQLEEARNSLQSDLAVTFKGIELVEEGKFVHLKIVGKLDTKDYELFVPEIDRQIERYGKLNMLLELIDFKGWSVGAAWEDTKFGFKHFNDVKKLAIVGDKAWEKAWPIFVRYLQRRQCAILTSANVMKR